MRHLVVVLVMLLAACSSSVDTRIRVEAAYDDGWDLTTFSLQISGGTDGPLEATTSAAEELLLLVPDDWAERTVAIALDGRRGSQRWAYGRVEVVPEVAQEVTATIALSLLPCGAWCSEGATQCEAGGISICEQRDSDACLEWSEPVLCAAAAPFCSFGVCDDTCADECALGETRCDGSRALRSCGQAPGDVDDCLDWLPAEPCVDGELCSADQCTTTCDDACVEGAVECSGAGTHTCGDLDANDCLEWGPIVPCPDGESCSGGACAPGCTDDCSDAACEDNELVGCGQYDLDACLDWSPGTTCLSTDPCSVGGACQRV